jgi:hypothetical protein
MKDWASMRATRQAGFDDHAKPAASPRLTDAVVASLALASLSLCVIIALTVLSANAIMVMPFSS